MFLWYNDIKKYLYFLLFFLWALLSMHITYMYMQTTGKKVYIKGWTFIEWVLNQPINPLPYLWNNDISKYVQSFLFKWCLDIELNNSICFVSTKDYKTFNISILTWNWSDNTPITLDDIYFTYQNIIKDNKFELDSLANYNWLEINKKNAYIQVKFPVATKNNEYFFTLPILPFTKLEFADRLFYSTKYLTEFTNSTCVKILDKSDMKENTILDFSNCDNYLIKNYQFKNLSSMSEMFDYLTGNIQIDIYKWLSNIDENKFNENKVFIDDYYVLFYNHDGILNINQKEILSLYLNKKLRENSNIKDVNFTGYLFELEDKDYNLEELKKSYVENVEKWIEKDILSQLVWLTNDKMKFLLTWNNLYYTPKSLWTWKLTLEGNIGTWHTTIGVKANNKGTYWLTSYQSGDVNFNYTISSTYNNIKDGKNIYEIISRKWIEEETLWTVIFYYKEAETFLEEKRAYVENPQIKVLYMEDNSTIEILWDAIFSELEAVFGSWYVQAKEISTKEEFKEILETGSYDIVLSNINISNTPDISPIFASDSPLQNHSRFTNSNFAYLIRQYYTSDIATRWKIYKEIQQIYKKEIPLFFLWKKIQKLYVDKRYGLDFGWNLWVIYNRKSPISDIKLMHTSQFDINLLSFRWFLSFVRSNIDSKYLESIGF